MSKKAQRRAVHENAKDTKLMKASAKRLRPTAETVRRLYLLSGNQCAFPGCTHPIIVSDGKYVGKLCHICAAEEGGERFDPAQTNEERRQFENLLLLCHDHHVVTDDVGEYPVERMRQIKAEHENRFAIGLASMMEAASVQISDSIVSLGGEGGKAPGAGGGGGGAIGPGAIGGRGGSGGEIKEGVFDLDDDIVALRVHIGKSGEGGTEGKRGSDGEDTVVEFLRHDGSAQEILRAKAGKGGDAGIGSARVRSPMLADSAEIRDGLIFALGAGWTWYTVESFPSHLSFGIVYIAEPDSAPIGAITTSIFNDRSDLVAYHTQHFDFSRGSVPFCVRALAPVTQAGKWCVVLSCGDCELARLPFDVLLQKPI